MEQLDDPSRISQIRSIISEKPSLKRYYELAYRRYADCLQRCPKSGLALELGSGAGFTKEVLPEIITSDVLPYEGVDQIIDGTRLPFADASLRFIGMHNVFHHIPDVEAFLFEAQRALMPGGRLFIIDQHVGLISKPILSHIHHEPFDVDAKEWSFATTGPLSGANGALAWIVFRRDQERFKKQYHKLKILRYQPHTPLFYWLTGGLKTWNLLPRFLFSTVEIFDQLFLWLSPSLGSFVDIEVEKSGKVWEK
jgi:SAM-dependent methyltransferase